MRSICFNYINRLILLVALALTAAVGQAQLLRTSYFMESAHYRMQLNPAMTPSRGYVHLPAISNIGASYMSNGIGLADLIDIIKNSDEADYFVSNAFMNRLKDENHAIANVGTDIFAAGWWHGKSFMSLNIGVKVDGSLMAPKALFSFMRDMRGMSTIDYSNYERSIGNEELNVTAYTEIGFGYTRQVNDRLSVGGRVKGLLGLGNAKLKVNKAIVKTNLEDLDPDYDWTHGDPAEVLRAKGTTSIDVEADLECSVQGLELLTNGKDYIDDLKFKTSKMGIAGAGAALDLGVAYRITGGLTLSAAVTDLGFIRWSKGSTTVAHSNTSDLHFDTEDEGDLMRFADIVNSTQPLNGDLLRLYIDEQAAKARTTSLSSSIVAGVEYAVNHDKLRLGALYSHHNDPVKAKDELTFSVNLHPSSLVDVAVSYSPICCGGQSVGVALKAGPLIIGTDYIYTGKNTKCCNALFGLSIPLGKRPDRD